MGSIPITRSSFRSGNGTPHVPDEPLLVGVASGMQGFESGTGACLGAISRSDTFDFTAR